MCRSIFFADLKISTECMGYKINFYHDTLYISVKGKNILAKKKNMIS